VIKTEEQEQIPVQLPTPKDNSATILIITGIILFVLIGGYIIYEKVGNTNHKWLCLAENDTFRAYTCRNECCKICVKGSNFVNINDCADSEQCKC